MFFERWAVRPASLIDLTRRALPKDKFVIIRQDDNVRPDEARKIVKDVKASGLLFKFLTFFLGLISCYLSYRVRECDLPSRGVC